MSINEISTKDKECPMIIFRQNKEIIHQNIINIRNKKIQEEIKDIIIDKYRTKIINQQKEIEKLKKKLDETIKTSLIILKNSFNFNQNNNNNILSPKSQKQKLKTEILNINNKNDIIVHILNRNRNKNLSYCTISSDNIKLKKSITQTNGLTVECKKTLQDNNLSLSSSRIQINKYDIITPKRIKIDKSKSKQKNKKEGESARHTINNIDINDLNTYYLKEYNKKDHQKIEGIKTKLLNNNLPECIKKQKNKNNNTNIYKIYSQNKNKNYKKQNLASKSNNYSYGKNNLKNVFNSPKSIKNEIIYNEKNKYFNEYYIKSNQINKKNQIENKLFLDNNNHYIKPILNTKNIIHRNININNNNNKIYINTDNNINSNVYLHNLKGIHNHFKTQANFYQYKVINKPDNQFSSNYIEVMKTTPNEYNINN